MTKHIPKDVDHSVNVSPEHPLQDFLILATAFAILIVCIVALSIFISSKVADQITLEKEIQLFSGMRISKKSTSNKLSKLTEELFRPYFPDSSVKLSTNIHRSREINAFAGLGGQVTLTRGFLDGAKTENELAFVICHEIGHHYNRDVIQGVGSSLMLALFTSTFGLDNILTNVSNSLVVSKFSRDQETKADEFALGCLNRKYGHVNGAELFFTKLKEKSSAVEDMLHIELLSTHPLHEGRIEHIKNYSKSMGFRTSGDLTLFEK